LIPGSSAKSREGSGQRRFVFRAQEQSPAKIRAWSGWATLRGPLGTTKGNCPRDDLIINGVPVWNGNVLSPNAVFFRPGLCGRTRFRGGAGGGIVLDIDGGETTSTPRKKRCGTAALFPCLIRPSSYLNGPRFFNLPRSFPMPVSRQVSVGWKWRGLKSAGQTSPDRGEHLRLNKLMAQPRYPIPSQSQPNQLRITTTANGHGSGTCPLVSEHKILGDSTAGPPESFSANWNIGRLVPGPSDHAQTAKTARKQPFPASGPQKRGRTTTGPCPNGCHYVVLCPASGRDK